MTNPNTPDSNPHEPIDLGGLEVPEPSHQEAVRQAANDLYKTYNGGVPISTESAARDKAARTVSGPQGTELVLKGTGSFPQREAELPPHVREKMKKELRKRTFGKGVLSRVEKRTLRNRQPRRNKEV